MNTFFNYLVVLSFITSINTHGMNIKNLQKIACTKQLSKRTIYFTGENKEQLEKRGILVTEEFIKDRDEQMKKIIMDKNYLKEKELWEKKVTLSWEEFFGRRKAKPYAGELDGPEMRMKEGYTDEFLDAIEQAMKDHDKYIKDGGGVY